MDETTDIDAVNVWGDEPGLPLDHVIVALREAGRDVFTYFRLSSGDAVQLADQLYLLTKERP